MEIKPGYKNTELGIIPIEWNVLKIGDILKVLGGNAFKSSDSTTIGIKWLKIANVSFNVVQWNNESFLPNYLIVDNKRFLLKEDDCVLALTRPILDRRLKIARLTRADVPALLNQRVGKIEVNTKNDILYVYYVLQQFQIIDSILQCIAGSDPPNLSNKALYNISAIIPATKKEQNRIASALTDIDSLITSLDKLIAKKKLIKLGAMQELLTGKRRLPGFEGEWEEKKLGDIFYLSTGSSKSKFIVESGNHFIIDMGSVTPEGNLLYTKQTNNDKDILNKGDLIMPKDDIGGGKIIGKVGHIDKNYKYILGDHVYRLRIINGVSLFFSYLINSYKVNYNLKQKVTGTAQLGISKKSVEEQNLLFPSDEKEQIALTKILKDMDSEIKELELKLDKYKQIKQGMMQELLTGRIRLIC